MYFVVTVGKFEERIVIKINRIVYRNDKWAGELFGNRGNIVLRDGEIIYFTIKNRKINTYEELVKQVDTFKWLYDNKKKIHEEYVRKYGERNN